MPSQKDQIERLSAENADLKQKVNSLSETVNELKAALEVLNVSHGETTTRVEAVEENLCLLKSEQKELEQDLTSTMLRLEGQQMYNRKQTLLLTGSAVELPVRGEDTREVVLRLLSTYLAVTGVSKHDISACHQLKNPKVILVRFTHLDDSDRIYRARTKPKRTGLLIFESLTTERLSVIETVKALKNDQSSSVLSYFTQGGKIFVRTSESRDVKPVEIPFGCGPELIRDICDGKKVSPPDVAIRDQFRAIHNRGRTEGHRVRRDNNPWVTVNRNNRGKTSSRVPPPSGEPSQGVKIRSAGGPQGGTHPRGGSPGGQSGSGSQGVSGGGGCPAGTQSGGGPPQDALPPDSHTDLVQGATSSGAQQDVVCNDS